MSGGSRIALALVGAALCTGSAVAADVPSFSKGRGFDARSGEALYRSICQGCHMTDGRGAVGAGRYPSLVADARLATASYPVLMVLNGNGAMPSFAGALDDAQVAAVVGYVRTHFDNRYDDAVAPAQVTALRTRPAPR